MIALDKVTLGSAQSTVTFSSIPQGYTDLVLVIAGRGTRTGNTVDGNIRFNSDTGSNYSVTYLYGDGSSASSARASNQTAGNAGLWYPAASTTSGIFTANTIHIMNYSNTTTNKTWLTRDSNQSNTGALVGASVNLWRPTVLEAINRIDLTLGVGDWATGSTFSLYGIAAQVTPGTAKATGGTITYDNFGRVIHTFTSSGTFTPSEPLTGVDYLVVAGGGGGGSAGSNSVRGAGGGGAGGYRTFTSQNISTAQTITIGAGGAGAPASSIAVGSNGSNSVASTITSTGGGGGAAQGLNAAAGGSGGGAGDAGSSAGTGNQGGYSPVEGYAGGANGPGAVNSGAGGGGSSAVGSPGIDLGASGGAGGAGTSNSITSTATTYAVGGNGGSYNSGVAGASGTTNRGNGGGGAAGSSGGYVAGGAGGSGVVIIRYSGL